MDIRNADGWTPLHAAASRGHVDVVRMLVEKKAAVDVQSVQGTTPLYHACEGGHTAVVSYLLESAGADVNLGKEKSWKPIHIVTYNGYLKLAALLIGRGAKLNEQNDEIKGYTPLHILIATKKPSLDTIKLLLDHGADQGIQNENGQSALHLAVFWNHDAVVRLLVERGADLKKLNSRSRTPLDLAAHYGFRPLAEFLASRMGVACPEISSRSSKRQLKEMEKPDAPPLPEKFNK